MPGVPARLRGLEKLNDGRGRTEDSEPTDGDLLKEPTTGDAMALVKAALPEESLRGGKEWKEPAMLPEPSSSVGTSGEEVLLAVLREWNARGGANPISSKEPCFRRCFSGEPCVEAFARGDDRGTEWSLRGGEAGVCSSGWAWISLWSGDGERTLLPPKKGSGALN